MGGCLRPYLSNSLHIFIVVWVTLLTYWFWTVYLRKGQVFWLQEIPVGGRISAPSKLQKLITWFPVASLFSCITLLLAVGTYDYWKDCNSFLSVLVMVASVLSESIVHNIFLRISCAWCILHNEVTTRQRQRFALLIFMLNITAMGYHLNLPFFFTTLVMVYCSALTLEFHNIVFHLKKLREAIVEQEELLRREANDVANALIEQMKLQLKLLTSFQQMLGVYLTAQIVINGPLYLFIGRIVAVCIARKLLDLGVFVYLLIMFSECHVNAFPYIAFRRRPASTGSHRWERLDQPEVWTYYSKDVSLDIEQLTNGDLYLGIPLRLQNQSQSEGDSESSSAPLSLVYNPSAVQYNKEDANEQESICHTAVEAVVDIV